MGLCVSRAKESPEPPRRERRKSVPALQSSFFEEDVFHGFIAVAPLRIHSGSLQPKPEWGGMLEPGGAGPGQKGAFIPDSSEPRRVDTKPLTTNASLPVGVRGRGSDCPIAVTWGWLTRAMLPGHRNRLYRPFAIVRGDGDHEGKPGRGGATHFLAPRKRGWPLSSPSTSDACVRSDRCTDEPHYLAPARPWDPGRSVGRRGRDRRWRRREGGED